MSAKTASTPPISRAACRAASGPGDAIVYVRADRAIPYGEVIDILGRFEAGGFTRVSLLTAPAPDGSK